MNTENNKQKWIKMVEETLELGGRSKVTIRNYLYAINHFLNAHGNNTNIVKFNEKNIIKYLRDFSKINPHIIREEGLEKWSML